ncbi:MAG: heme-binding domain-containing protein [Flavobacteriaceae bacterium]|nr:heme-binding domain-containing protein [Flavobacteriaceae bacterium]
MKIILKRIAILLLGVFVVMQFFGPEKNISEIARVDNKNDFIVMENPSKNIEDLLIVACYDCHSNSTRYPWYNTITPVNYWMADHVRHGKGELNFSEWGNYSPANKDHKIDESIEMLEDGEMPLNSYIWTHADAKLSEEQVKTLTHWFSLLRLKILKDMPQ